MGVEGLCLGNLAFRGREALCPVGEALNAAYQQMVRHGDNGSGGFGNSMDDVAHSLNGE